ncbi:hypothetical protein A1O1_02191 [Capronia coronata CBS 617.96]|uniref:F-box domain-containing protein n=1 Tax=Capronia coronata CBS 617.96 TaxID=1182541 RepID=W9YML1_9EURO|nr:uncharacterized protein A1O1_02191 [Capronia coronata CBS 617.96]EXJ93798.1 hypothetical protein A1O1_02191 [Capronia coronata CBS 617.96]
MPPSWRDGLVNAFPIPQDRLKTKNKKLLQQGVHLENVSNTSEEGDEALPPGKPFPFLELPAEIRNRIYRLVLFSKPGYRGADGRKKSRTSILAVSKKVHQEASYILYSSLSFRIFPLQDFTPVPTIQELRPMYRAMVTQLELVVGSSWTGPPKSWRVNKVLARHLGRLSAVQILKVFVQLDPSVPMYEKYRISFDFYTDFCGNLLHDVLVAMPHVTALVIDGNPGIDTTGPLVSRLLAEAKSEGKVCTLGPNKTLSTPTGLKKPIFWI